MSGRGHTKIIMREYTESLLVAVLLALFLRFFVVSAYKIPTSSMFPTLKVGDFIFAYKLPYGIPVPFTNGERWGQTLPARGDVVVFRYPGNESVNYVKRVVGLPGDRISIKDHHLYINDKPAEYSARPNDLIRDLPGSESFLVMDENFAGTSHLMVRSSSDEADFFGPVVVPAGQVFVLGDNRDSSDDSRYWGTVPLRNLEGQVVLIWLSLDWLNRWGGDQIPSIRWDRWMKRIE